MIVAVPVLRSVHYFYALCPTAISSILQAEPDLPEASGGERGAAGGAQEPEEPEEPAERLPAGADAPGDRPLQAQGAAPATGHHLHQTHQPV